MDRIDVLAILRVQECGFGISLMFRIFDDIHADVIVAAAGVYRSPEIAASNNCAYDGFGATSRNAKEMTRKRTQKEVIRGGIWSLLYRALMVESFLRIISSSKTSAE